MTSMVSLGLTFDSEVGGGLIGVRLDGDLAGVFQLGAVDDQFPFLSFLQIRFKN